MRITRTSSGIHSVIQSHSPAPLFLRPRPHILTPGPPHPAELLQAPWAIPLEHWPEAGRTV